MPTLTDLSHMLYRLDLCATVAFYVAMLGFTLDERNDRWVGPRSHAIPVR
jgi:hypothetical protein